MSRRSRVRAEGKKVGSSPAGTVFFRRRSFPFGARYGRRATRSFRKRKGSEPEAPRSGPEENRVFPTGGDRGRRETWFLPPERGRARSGRGLRRSDRGGCRRGEDRGRAKRGGFLPGEGRLGSGRDCFFPGKVVLVRDAVLLDRARSFPARDDLFADVLWRVSRRSHPGPEKKKPAPKRSWSG